MGRSYLPMPVVNNSLPFLDSSLQVFDLLVNAGKLYVAGLCTQLLCSLLGAALKVLFSEEKASQQQPGATAMKPPSKGSGSNSSSSKKQQQQRSPSGDASAPFPFSSELVCTWQAMWVPFVAMALCHSGANIRASCAEIVLPTFLSHSLCSGRALLSSGAGGQSQEPSSSNAVMSIHQGWLPSVQSTQLSAPPSSVSAMTPPTSNEAADITLVSSSLAPKAALTPPSFVARVLWELSSIARSFCLSSQGVDDRKPSARASAAHAAAATTLPYLRAVIAVLRVARRVGLVRMSSLLSDEEAEVDTDCSQRDESIGSGSDASPIPSNSPFLRTWLARVVPMLARALRGSESPELTYRQRSQAPLSAEDSASHLLETCLLSSDEELRTATIELVRVRCSVAQNTSLPSAHNCKGFCSYLLLCPRFFAIMQVCFNATTSSQFPSNVELRAVERALPFILLSASSTFTASALNTALLLPADSFGSIAPTCSSLSSAAVASGSGAAAEHLSVWDTLFSGSQAPEATSVASAPWWDWSSFRSPALASPANATKAVQAVRRLCARLLASASSAPASAAISASTSSGAPSLASQPKSLIAAKKRGGVFFARLVLIALLGAFGGRVPPPPSSSISSSSSIPAAAGDAAEDAEKACFENALSMLLGASQSKSLTIGFDRFSASLELLTILVDIAESCVCSALESEFRIGALLCSDELAPITAWGFIEDAFPCQWERVRYRAPRLYLCRGWYDTFIIHCFVPLVLFDRCGRRQDRWLSASLH